jgi:hypothetical protein
MDVEMPKVGAEDGRIPRSTARSPFSMTISTRLALLSFSKSPCEEVFVHETGDDLAPGMRHSLSLPVPRMDALLPSPATTKRVQRTTSVSGSLLDYAAEMTSRHS